MKVEVDEFGNWIFKQDDCSMEKSLDCVDLVTPEKEKARDEGSYYGLVDSCKGEDIYEGKSSGASNRSFLLTCQSKTRRFSVGDVATLQFHHRRYRRLSTIDLTIDSPS